MVEASLTVGVRQRDAVLSCPEDLAEVAQGNLASGILVKEQAHRLDAGPIQILSMKTGRWF